MNISTLQIRKPKTEVIEYNSHEATGDGGTELQWEARQSNLILNTCSNCTRLGPLPQV